MPCNNLPYLVAIFLFTSGIFIFTSFTDYVPYEINFFLETPKQFTPLSKKIGLECWKLFENDTEYINYLRANRIKFNGSEEIKTDCKSIKERSFFASQKNSKEVEEFPIAFAKIVYTDYLLLEMELSAEYAPQNFYCFSIDLKAGKLFQEQMRNLSSCLPNVFITKQQFDTDGTGHNHNHAYIECFKELLKYKWKYVILFQNHDIILRTNAELVQIFKWFNGTNDISVYMPMMHRINSKFNWTFSALNLFKDPQRNIHGANGFPPKLTFAKSMVESSLSRAMVEFLINDLNLTTFMENLQYRKPTSPEESMLATIQGTDALNAPGGFTHICLDKHKMSVPSITRKSMWAWSNSFECKSRKFRHSLCVFGVEDLYHLEAYPNILLNKMMPSFDFAAIACWHERLYNRSYLNAPAKYNLNPDYFLNLPHVRFHHEKLKNGKVDLEKFECNLTTRHTTMIKNTIPKIIF